MNEQRLIEALHARAEEDARLFRKTHPGETPSERWIENSYTAALPLAKDSAGVDPGLGPHPHLFSAYREHIGELLGERVSEHVSQRDDGDELTQQPTPGEN